MIALSKITSKNQTTVPKAVLDILHAGPSDQLVYEIEGETITLRAKTGRLVDLAGKFAHFGNPQKKAMTEKAMEETLMDHASSEDARIRAEWNAKEKKKPK